MKVSQQYPYPWLKPEDLQGAQRKVQVERVEMIEFKKYDGEGKEKKFVLSFVGKEKKLVLNKPDAIAFSQVAGDDSDEWPGQTLHLYPTVINGKPKIRFSQVIQASGDSEF
jgi:hypothetical protein